MDRGLATIVKSLGTRPNPPSRKKSQVKKKKSKYLNNLNTEKLHVHKSLILSNIPIERNGCIEFRFLYLTNFSRSYCFCVKSNPHI